MKKNKKPLHNSENSSDEDPSYSDSSRRRHNKKFKRLKKNSPNGSNSSDESENVKEKRVSGGKHKTRQAADYIEITGIFK